MHIIKLPANITVGGIKQFANESLATSFYIKNLMSIFYIQKRFHKMYKLVDTIIPPDSQYAHINWIKNYSSGTGSLDLYRVVKKNNSVIFLKYYFKNSVELFRNMYFSKNISEEISYYISTSKLLQTRNSELISELGFEFINSSERVCNQETRGFIIYIVNTLNKNFKLNSMSNLTNIPEILLDYRSHFEYQRSKSEIIEKYVETDIENIISFFESQINASNHVLAHGDLHIGNTINESLIDWDNFGFYPLGFDAAFASWKLNIDLENKQKVIEFKENNFSLNIPPCDKEEFNRNYFLFLLIFTRNNYKWMSETLISIRKKIK
jgi:hypothetical protein